MEDSIKIRLYDPKDRLEVREISCDTADKGEPVENFFPDRRLIADLLTIYYTKYESGSLLVAEFNGKVIGYLTGCLDSRRYQKLMAVSIAPFAVLKALFRGVLFYRKTWRLLKSLFLLWLKGGASREINIDDYPAHLHINIRKGFRGKRIGHRLVEKFMEYMKEKGVSGIHVSVAGNNLLSQKFFEGLGFTQLNRYPTLYCNAKSHEVGYTIIYAKKFNQK
ncbi:MAG: GNAT family N-acetyltransferase [Candidatus Omnitrophica bacterium]|nr:GNAT family N-acetyltransferase [Candidatus Omnitrophota bacterium]